MNSYTLRRLFFDGFTFAYLAMIVFLEIAQPSEEELNDISPYVVKFLIGFLLGGGLSHFLNKMNIRTWGEVIFEPAFKKAHAPDKSLLKSFWGWHFIVTFVVTLVIGFIVTKSSVLELLDEEGFKGAVRLFDGLTSPNMDILPKAILNIIETIFMAFMATTLAIPFAFILSFFCAKNIMKHPAALVVYYFLRTLLNVSRSIEALIWAIIFSVWVGIGPFAGMLALMIHSIASLAKQYSEMVESVNEGPIEGIQSTGAGFLQVIWFAIVPQVILPYISFTVYRWDINVRMATIIGLVGGGGIGTMLIKYQGQAMWPEVGTIIMVIAAVVWAMDQASAVIREALK